MLLSHGMRYDCVTATAPHWGPTGDPLHSRAACTQHCNVNTHSRAHCSPGARLCEQWVHGCVNNEARLCASARLCRGSPVILRLCTVVRTTWRLRDWCCRQPGTAWVLSVVTSGWRLRDCCCCLHGPVWVQSVVWSAWRPSDCCYCLIGTVRLCTVVRTAWRRRDCCCRQPGTGWVLSVVRSGWRLRDWCCCFHWGRLTEFCCRNCVSPALQLLLPAWTSLSAVFCLACTKTAWLLLLPHWGRMTAFCCRLHDCCCCLIRPVWLWTVVGTMADCVTVAAASLGAYDCVLLSWLWPTAWLLLLPHWGRMTAFRCRTMGDCVTAAAAPLGLYDCVLLSGLWVTAWLLLLPHWGRMTAFCVRDYGRLRDCCCCLIGAVWLRSVFGTMGDCVTAAAAPLGPYDCVLCSGLWATAWLLLLPHWGRMTASCCQDYGRLRDCCCCPIGTVWLRSVFGTMGDCVTAAAVCLGQPQYRLLPRVREDCVSFAAACNSLRAVCCLVCVKTAWLVLLPIIMPECCLLSVLCACCCCEEGVAFIFVSVWCVGGARRDWPQLRDWCCWLRHWGRLLPSAV